MTESNQLKMSGYSVADDNNDNNNNNDFCSVVDGLHQS